MPLPPRRWERWIGARVHLPLGRRLVLGTGHTVMLARALGETETDDAHSTSDESDRGDEEDALWDEVVRTAARGSP